jgi:hypothetical protein
VEIEVPTGSKFNVCGDVHGFSSQVARFWMSAGQFYDLCNIFQIGGLPAPDNPFLCKFLATFEFTVLTS